MREIVNLFLFAGNKFIPQMDLRQAIFVYSTSEPFTNANERMKYFKETGDGRNIYRNKNTILVKS